MGEEIIKNRKQIFTKMSGGGMKSQKLGTSNRKNGEEDEITEKWGRSKLSKVGNKLSQK